MVRPIGRRENILRCRANTIRPGGGGGGGPPETIQTRVRPHLRAVGELHCRRPRGQPRRNANESGRSSAASARALLFFSVLGLLAPRASTSRSRLVGRHFS
ncbi:Hypothetical predicted protein [Olea europaea subsp. europaea]|uniref:Uncharacterized protein n=1 Tax=Olea europaea subsp. europaea TaxID=158383 RepID=A0A8S0Q487_OLEEU|nr:Hypothetical predicted protein [Olea europaea subsp. europaea]